ncbi:MAG TPA: hypothetical protein VMC03_20130 [Streptosporangiaceae bacterium]|nr:hypothetical protein [Streptosporangiaceae bacterium]
MTNSVLKKRLSITSGQRDQPDGQVDPDDRDGRVNGVLDDRKVPLDVAAAANAVDDRGESHGHIRRHLLPCTFGHRCATFA